MKFSLLTLRKQKRNTKNICTAYRQFLEKKKNVRSASGRCFLRNSLSILRRITANTVKYIAARPALRFLSAILNPFYAKRRLTESSERAFGTIGTIEAIQ